MELKMDTGIKGQNTVSQSRQVQAAQEYTGPLTSAERRQQAREDKLELSKEAIEFLQGQGGAAEGTEVMEEEANAQEPMTPAEKRQQAQAEKLKAAKQMLDVLREQSAQMKEQSEKQADALKKAMDKMKKCMRIASNIGKGHKVPPQDEKYLLENDPKAYMMAMVMRMMEEEKKKVKSELDDEDTQAENNQGAEPVSAAEGAGGEISVDAAVETSVE